MNFQDKVVLITGASSGIGKAAALSYAAAGAKLILSDIQAEKGEAVVQEITQQGGKALFIATDVTQAEAVQALVKQGVETYGQLDIAINNAGIATGFAKTSHLSHQEWERVIAVNQHGVFYCMQAELQVMEQQGHGAIVNVASIAGLKGFPGQLPYAASKHAVVGMTKSAALEYTRQPIRINAVCPVFTHSPMLDQLFEERPDYEQKLIHSIPLRRYGEAQEIVQAIQWLSSDAASFTTGLALPVDGGQLA